MLLGAGTAVLVLGGIRATAWLIGPAFLALIVVIALYPVQACCGRVELPGRGRGLVELVRLLSLRAQGTP
jgi:hypothetical protein